MRIRTLKPEWLDDERIVLAGSDARVLSIALILLADDYGNGRANKMITGSRVFPHKPSLYVGALKKLVDIGFVQLYTDHEQMYYHIRNWDTHQKVDHPGKPHVPDPSVCNDKENEGVGNFPESLANIPESLAPDLRTSTSTYGPVPVPKDHGQAKEIREIFEVWKQVHDHPKAKLDAKRKLKIVERLKEGYSPDDLKGAIRGAKYDKWMQGENDTGKIFDNIGTILREATTVDRHLETWEERLAEEARTALALEEQEALAECERITKEHGRDSTEYAEARSKFDDINQRRRLARSAAPN